MGRDCGGAAAPFWQKPGPGTRPGTQFLVFADEGWRYGHACLFAVSRWSSDVTAPTSPAQSLVLPLGERLPAAFAAALFGAFIILGVGFVQIAAVHNAAHDTRHGINFPCH